jgi:hypothetical protein
MPSEEGGFDDSRLTGNRPADDAETRDSDDPAEEPRVLNFRFVRVVFAFFPVSLLPLDRRLVDDCRRLKPSIGGARDDPASFGEVLLRILAAPAGSGGMISGRRKSGSFGDASIVTNGV